MRWYHSFRKWLISSKQMIVIGKFEERKSTLFSRSDFFSIDGGLIVRARFSVGFDADECVVNGRANGVSFEGTISFGYFRSCVAKDRQRSFPIIF